MFYTCFFFFIYFKDSLLLSTLGLLNLQDSKSEKNLSLLSLTVRHYQIQ